MKQGNLLRTVLQKETWRNTELGLSHTQNAVDYCFVMFSPFEVLLLIVEDRLATQIGRELKARIYAGLEQAGEVYGGFLRESLACFA